MRARIIAAMMLSVAGIAPAQSVGRMIVDDVKNAGGDMIRVWASPFHASGNDWLLAAGAAGAFGITTFADRSVAEWAARNESTALFRALRPVRRGGIAYTGRAIVPPFAALYIAGIATKNQDLRDAVMGCASAWMSEQAVRMGSHYVVTRQRPDTSPTDPHRWGGGNAHDWQLHSFPAGHFANAMACASFWNHRFALGVAGPVLYAVAGAIGAGRIVDGGHWTSDTVLGGILGYAIGREVARRSVSRVRADADRRRAGVSLAPEPGAAVLRFRITF